MKEIVYQSIQPFIPSGQDYALARAFFAELGFDELWENDGMAGFQCGDCQFLLQRYDNDQFAQNLMIKLVVPDLDTWWACIQAKSLEEKFPGVRFNPPTSFPWGREVNFIDPAGVCWHVMAD